MFKSSDGGGDQEVVISEIPATPGPLHHLQPSYPFPADFSIEFCGTRIEVIRHKCMKFRAGSEDVEAIAIFFPGVHGGVGPCRQPGTEFDDEALFPSVCHRLQDQALVNIDCYRVSWPFVQPAVEEAVSGGLRVLNYAMMQALRPDRPSNHQPSKDERVKGRRHERRKHKKGDTLHTLNVVFIGHSLGGAIALQTASVVARHFGPDVASTHLPAVMQIRGLCVLNTALMVSNQQEMDQQLASLTRVRTLLVSGMNDQVVAPLASKTLFNAVPSLDKRHLELEGGTHDLFSHKAKLLTEVTQFINDCTATEQLSEMPRQ